MTGDPTMRRRRFTAKEDAAIRRLYPKGAAQAVRAAVLVCPAPPSGIPLLSWEVMRRQPRYLPDILRSRPLLPSFEDNAPVALNKIPEGERAAVEALARTL